jgi:hypothetical protein
MYSSSISCDFSFTSPQYNDDIRCLLHYAPDIIVVVIVINCLNNARPRLIRKTVQAWTCNLDRQRSWSFLNCNIHHSSTGCSNKMQQPGF